MTTGYINTTKTYNEIPTAGEFLLSAYNLCQVRPTELTNTHLALGERAMNFILSEISNMQPNLWESELKYIPLGAGTPTYSLPSEIVQITDMFIRINANTSNPIDRYVSPISTTEYMALSNKMQQGFPNQYWFFRGISPTVTFYFVPDSNGPYLAGYRAVRQTQDIQLANGDTVEIPYRWHSAFVTGVAWQLARSYAPQLKDSLFAEYQRCLGYAQTNDTENVSLMIVPGVGGYFRP